MSPQDADASDATQSDVTEPDVTEPDATEPEAEKAPSTKDAFRAALERKKAKQHPHEAASQSDSKVHDEHGAAGGKRTFRRKSG